MERENERREIILFLILNATQTIKIINNYSITITVANRKSIARDRFKPIYQNSQTS